MTFFSRKGAKFGGKVYRFSLTRDWDSFENPVRACFILLNPSIADADRDDPTVTRCIGFAHKWGYEGLEIVNLFAFRATNPAELYTAEDPVGAPENYQFLREAIVRAGIVIVGWGLNAKMPAKYRTHLPGHVLKMVRRNRPDLRPMALGFNSDRSPKHPLYISAAQEPFEYTY
jgi:hypothetical protein